MNFMAYKINRGTRKLIQTSKLICKKIIDFNVEVSKKTKKPKKPKKPIKK